MDTSKEINFVFSPTEATYTLNNIRQSILETAEMEIASGTLCTRRLHENDRLIYPLYVGKLPAVHSFDFEFKIALDRNAMKSLFFNGANGTNSAFRVRVSSGDYGSVT